MQRLIYIFKPNPSFFVVKSSKNVYFFKKIKFHIPIDQSVQKTSNPAANTSHNPPTVFNHYNQWIFNIQLNSKHIKSEQKEQSLLQYSRLFTVVTQLWPPYLEYVTWHNAIVTATDADQQTYLQQRTQIRATLFEFKTYGTSWNTK